jgi:hypothetical protein
MALNISDVHVGSRDRGVSPDWRMVIKDVTADNAYPAGGYAVTPAQFGLSSIIAVVPCDTPDGAHVVYNNATGKLLFYVSGTAASKLSESGATTVNGSVARLLVIGK